MLISGQRGIRNKNITIDHSIMQDFRLIIFVSRKQQTPYKFKLLLSYYTVRVVRQSLRVCVVLRSGDFFTSCR